MGEQGHYISVCVVIVPTHYQDNVPVCTAKVIAGKHDMKTLQKCIESLLVIIQVADR